MPVPHHSFYLQAGCPSCRPTNSVIALKANNSTQHLYMCKNFGLKIPNGYENNDKRLLQSIFIKTSSTRATYSSSCLSISNSLARLLNGGTGISSCHNVHHHHQHHVMAPPSLYSITMTMANSIPPKIFKCVASSTFSSQPLLS